MAALHMHIYMACLNLAPLKLRITLFGPKPNTCILAARQQSVIGRPTNAPSAERILSTRASIVNQRVDRARCDKTKATPTTAANHYISNTILLDGREVGVQMIEVQSSQ